MHLPPPLALPLLSSGSPCPRDLALGLADPPELKGGPGTAGRGRWHGGISRTKTFQSRERERESKARPFFFPCLGQCSDIFFHLVSLASGRPPVVFHRRNCPLSDHALPTNELNPRNAEKTHEPNPIKTRKKKNLQRRSVAARAEGGASPPPPPPAPVKKDRSGDQLIFASEQSLRYV